MTQGGLRAKYYDNVWFLNSPVVERVDDNINFNWGTGTLTNFGVDYVSIRWEGKLRANYSEEYQISALADDGVRVWLDRVKVIDTWDGECCQETWATVRLVENDFHDIIVEYKELRDEAKIELRWQSPSTGRGIIPPSSFYYRTPIDRSPFKNIVMGPAPLAHAGTSSLIAPAVWPLLSVFGFLLIIIVFTSIAIFMMHESGAHRTLSYFRSRNSKSPKLAPKRALQSL